MSRASERRNNNSIFKKNYHKNVYIRKKSKYRGKTITTKKQKRQRRKFLSNQENRHALRAVGNEISRVEPSQHD